MEPDPGIVQSLKSWRDEIADEAGVPPHYILANDTLSELARCRPGNRDQLLTVKGIGPVKVERYGTTLLEILDQTDRQPTAFSPDTCAGLDHEPKTQTSESQAGSEEPPTDAMEGSAAPPSHYWTKRLLQAGFSVDECAAIRGIGQEVVLEHARQAEREQ